MHGSYAELRQRATRREATQTRTTLTVSVVVELENARLSDLARFQAMLRRLADQAARIRDEHSQAGVGPADAARFLKRLQTPLELLVLYDEDEIDGGDAHRALSETVPTDSGALRWQLIPARGQRYYELKNMGARHATGDIILFLDSDVVPEDAWLGNLLGSFADPQVQVVGGNTYVEPSSLYAKTFALVWFFPLRATQGALKPVRAFYANNVAFRREVWERYPFEPIVGTARGACGQLARTLQSEGIGVYLNTAAQVSHPAPNGAKHFVARALVEGRDHLVKLKQTRPQRAGVLRSFGRFLSRCWKSLWSILVNGRRVGLSWPAMPAAACIAFAYYALFLAGDIISRVFPRLFDRGFFRV